MRHNYGNNQYRIEKNVSYYKADVTNETFL